MLRQILKLLFILITEDPFARLRQKVASRYDFNSPTKTTRLRYHGKSIYFSRHGESVYNVENKVGGDSPLSDRGSLYARALGRYINSLGKCYTAYHNSKLL